MPRNRPVEFRTNEETGEREVLVYRVWRAYQPLQRVELKEAETLSVEYRETGRWEQKLVDHAFTVRRAIAMLESHQRDLGYREAFFLDHVWKPVERVAPLLIKAGIDPETAKPFRVKAASR